MTSTRIQHDIGSASMAVCLVAGLLSGCTALGPTAIRSGRLTYNEAINETNNQQMLLVVIHNRYEQQGNLLAVASVTANVHVTASTGIELGFGDSDNFSGNLVPFGAAAVYEENPTISYVPVEGQKYLRRVTAPLPLVTLTNLAASLTDPGAVYAALVASVNGIYNPRFMLDSAEPDPRFARFASVMATLTRAHRLHWVEDPQHAGRLSLVIDHYAPDYAAEVAELLSLLGLPAKGAGSEQLVLPVSLALDGRDSGGVGITTRSVIDLVQMLSAAVELPEEHQRNGIAATFPPPGPVGRQIHIHHARARPQHAAVAVPYRDAWFYIDEKDQATKRFFRLLATLWSATIAESAAGAHAAPILTVPVSR
jgi:hypothetical protein